MVTKLSVAQRHALEILRRETRGAGETYMPYADHERTFAALARRGLAVWRTVDDGFRYNGYAITDAGKAALP